jgi:hypothetical protein
MTQPQLSVLKPRSRTMLIGCPPTGEDCNLCAYRPVDVIQRETPEFQEKWVCTAVVVDDAFTTLCPTSEQMKTQIASIELDFILLD